MSYLHEVLDLRQAERGEILQEGLLHAINRDLPASLGISLQHLEDEGTHQKVGKVASDQQAALQFAPDHGGLRGKGSV